MRQGSHRAVHRPEEIDLPHLPEVLPVGLLDGAVEADAGVVHQEVDSAEALNSLRHQVFHLLRCRDVSRNR